MTRCSKCQLSYPDHLTSGLVVAKDGRPQTVIACACCGLELQNKALGMNRRDFSKGTVAQAMLEECREYQAKMKGAPKP